MTDLTHDTGHLLTCVVEKERDGGRTDRPPFS